MGGPNFDAFRQAGQFRHGLAAVSRRIIAGTSYMQESGGCATYLLNRRLDQTRAQPISDETPGDLCYFRGWGAVAPLRVRTIYPLRLDHMS